MTPFEPLFRLDLPHGRCVGVALPDDAAPDGAVPPAVLAALPEGERRHVEGLPPLRRASWVGGRIALRAALADLSFDAGPILATARGAPSLLPGARGSISHKEDLAVGLAARVTLPSDRGAGGARDWHLGIDIERVGPNRADISGYVLRPEERARLPPPGDPRRDEELRFAFSAKEAIYKALDPFLGRYVSFQEVAVERRPDGTAAVALYLRPDTGADAAPVPAPFEVQVGWLLREGFILTTARVLRTP
jgi:enterobactin synthetase component D